MEYEKLIKAISFQTGLSFENTRKTLEALLGVINSELEAGRSINIADFGNFEVVASPDTNTITQTVETITRPKQELDIKKVRIGKKLLSLVPQHIAKQYNIAPVDLDNGLLTIIMLEPDDEVTELISKRTGLQINSLICDIYELEHALDQYNNL